MTRRNPNPKDITVYATCLSNPTPIWKLKESFRNHMFQGKFSEIGDVALLWSKLSDSGLAFNDSIPEETQSGYCLGLRVED